MINLDKTNSPFDLKNFDVSQITKFLTDYQKHIKIAIPLLSLLMVWNMFNDFHNKQAALNSQVSQAQEKLSVIKSREAAIQGLSTFKSSVPKGLNVFDLVTMISNAAKSSNSSISSYAPSPPKDMGLYDVINVSFIMTSEDFKDMMIFLRKIEKSPFPILINTWSGHKEDDGKISFTLAISAILIHP